MPGIVTAWLITEKVRSLPKLFVCESPSAVTYVSQREGQEVSTDEAHRLAVPPCSSPPSRAFHGLVQLNFPLNRQ